MKRFGYKISLTSLLLLLTLIVTGCFQTPNWEAESDRLLLVADSLNVQHAAIIAEIDSLWDETTAVLEASLPEDFPPVDRKIFLSARNADHIRMFQSYSTLPADVQELVDHAGEYDAVLASRIRALHHQKQQYLYQKTQFLESVSLVDQQAAQMYADAFRKVSFQKPE